MSFNRGKIELDNNGDCARTTRKNLMVAVALDVSIQAQDLNILKDLREDLGPTMLSNGPELPVLPKLEGWAGQSLGTNERLFFGYRSVRENQEF